MNIVRDIVALTAAARLTRLVTTDWLGEWSIVQPAKEWAENHDGPQDVHSVENQGRRPDLWRSRLVSGLDCPFCVGFWITAGTLAINRLPLPPIMATGRDLVLDALAGSYIVGHASSRIDV